jgi:glycosyltransferase involved in cell wall biosynthesis
MNKAPNPPRVAFYDNICNISYHIARALRNEMGYDAHLFLDHRFDLQRLPEHDDPSLASNCPGWIHKKNYERPLTIAVPGLSPLIRDLREYDCVVTMNWGARFAPFIRRPYAVWTAGGDLTIYPFPSRFSFLWPRWKDKIALWMKGYWQRRGLFLADEIWTQPFIPFQQALARLGLPAGKIASAYFPIPIDTSFWCRPPSEGALGACSQIRERFDFVVFHPSRLAIKTPPPVAEAGDWKRNDLLFEGFANFVRSARSERVGLVVIEREMSYDLRLAKEIIAQLGIERNVLWLKPPRQYGFSRVELVDLYAVSNVTAVDFGMGWFGSVLLEALAAGCPALSFIDEESMKKLYPWHPVLSAHTAQGIADHLMNLYRNRSRGVELGVRGRKWIEEFHSYKNVAPIYARHIQELISYDD